MNGIDIQAFVQQIDPKNNKAVLVATIPFAQLLKVVKKTSMKLGEDSGEYQRELDEKRVSGLKKHIRAVFNVQQRGDAKALFPTSIILANHNSMNSSEINIGGIARCTLSEGTVIVDGQHRFYGMEALYKEACHHSENALREKIENYYFSCTILVNYDLWEQACIFVDVNFNQKKVNRSLLYNIYGVILSVDANKNLYIPKQSNIYVAHEIVRRLQNHESSVLHGYIKMLGSGHGWVSQAFLVEALMKHMRPMGIWNYVSQDRIEGTHLIENLYMEVAALMACLRSTFIEFWPDEGSSEVQSVLCKTTGLGAAIQLLENLHDILSNQIKDIIKEGWISVIDYAELISTFAKALEPLKGYGKELYSLDSQKGKFAGTGGDGLQSKLYKRMKELMGM